MVKASHFLKIVWITLALAFCLPWVSQAENKPAVYDFGSHTCIPCKEMQKVMTELKARYGDQLDLRLIYMDEEKDLFSKFKVVLIPTQVFLDASGKEVDRHMGALSKEEVVRKLKELKFLP